MVLSEFPVKTYALEFYREAILLFVFYKEISKDFAHNIFFIVCPNYYRLFLVFQDFSFESFSFCAF